MGLQITTQMLEDTNLTHLFDGLERPSLWTLRSTYGFNTASSWEPYPRPNGKDSADRPEIARGKPPNGGGDPSAPT